MARVGGLDGGMARRHCPSPERVRVRLYSFAGLVHVLPDMPARTSDPDEDESVIVAAVADRPIGYPLDTR